VDRDTDSPGLVGDRTGDGLTDPPRCVRRELISATPLELIDRLHQTDVAFLDQIEELQAAVRILFGDRNNESKVGLDKLAFGFVGLGLADADRLVRTLDLDRGKMILLFDRGDLGLGLFDLGVKLTLLGRSRFLVDLLLRFCDEAFVFADLLDGLPDRRDQNLTRAFGKVQSLDLMSDLQTSPRRLTL